MPTAKVFMSGASQAVRLPKEFRLDESEVLIKRVGSMLLLVPKRDAWQMMENSIGAAHSDFMVDQEQPPKAEVRKRMTVPKRKRS